MAKNKKKVAKAKKQELNFKPSHVDQTFSINSTKYVVTKCDKDAVEYKAIASGEVFSA